MVLLVEQELLTLPEHLSSPPVFSGVCVIRSLVLFVCFVDCCLSFFFWPLCCLFCFDLRILFTPLYLHTLLSKPHQHIRLECGRSWVRGRVLVKLKTIKFGICCFSTKAKQKKLLASQANFQKFWWGRDALFFCFCNNQCWFKCSGSLYRKQPCMPST
jgi:hypothetical protein